MSFRAEGGGWTLPDVECLTAVGGVWKQARSSVVGAAAGRLIAAAAAGRFIATFSSLLLKSDSVRNGKRIAMPSGNSAIMHLIDPTETL